MRLDVAEMTNLFDSPPLLRSMGARATGEFRSALANTVLVGCQHLLETTGALIEELFACGLRPEHTFLMGKVYSSNDGVVERLRKLGVSVTAGSRATEPGGLADAMTNDATALWEWVLARGLTDRLVLVLDDGGHVTRTVPEWAECRAESRGVIGVEQTAGGLKVRRRGFLRCDVVSVAESAAKRLLESPMIVEAVRDRLIRSIPNLAKQRVGILGCGALGRSLADWVQEHGTLAGVYDVKRTDHLSEARSPHELVEASDVVIGCTGEPSLALGHIRGAQGRPLILASASSGDVEFSEILRHVRCTPMGTHVCPDLAIRRGASVKRPITVLRSGTPVNFDNSPESVPGDKIQITRALLFAGVAQALAMSHDYAGAPRTTVVGSPVMLSARAQMRTAQDWTDLSPGASAYRDAFADERAVRLRSGGVQEDGAEDLIARFLQLD